MLKTLLFFQYYTSYIQNICKSNNINMQAQLCKKLMIIIIFIQLSLTVKSWSAKFDYTNLVSCIDIGLYCMLFILLCNIPVR